MQKKHNIGKLGWEKGFVWNPDERNARRVKKTRKKEFTQKYFGEVQSQKSFFWKSGQKGVPYIVWAITTQVVTDDGDGDQENTKFGR